MIHKEYMPIPIGPNHKQRDVSIPCILGLSKHYRKLYGQRTNTSFTIRTESEKALFIVSAPPATPGYVCCGTSTPDSSYLIRSFTGTCPNSRLS